jgi:capsular polysaccharide transport system permease protein
MLFQDSGFAKAQDDVYAVRDFILSRNALRALDEESRLRKAFSGKAVDFFSRFPFFLYWDESFEALYLYYQRKVEVDVDSDSSILTLTTRAFSAEDSFRMNQRLLHLAEDLVNELNERGRQDLIRFAQREVDEAENRVKAAAVALARYRNEKGVIDPEHQSTIPLEQISKLQGDLIETRSQILQIEKVAQDNPQLPLLRLRARNLESAIQAINESVAGAGARSLAGKAADFQRLSLDLDVSGKLLAGALDTLQQARNAALRRQLYVEPIAQPVLPDKAMEPHRVRNIAATLALGLVLWGVVSLLVAAILEHRD